MELTESHTRTSLWYLTMKNKWGPHISAELKNAVEKFPPFNTQHEGYAVLLEEVDELWKDVKHATDPRDTTREAIQVAAMALRFLIDCCDLDHMEDTDEGPPNPHPSGFDLDRDAGTRDVGSGTGC